MIFLVLFGEQENFSLEATSFKSEKESLFLLVQARWHSFVVLSVLTPKIGICSMPADSQTPILKFVNFIIEVRCFEILKFRSTV